jgi:uncharacterized protein (TIGR03067 family)
MKTRILFGAFVVAAAVAYGQDSAAEIKALNGVWTPASAELGGKPFPDEVLKTMKLVMAGEAYTATVGKAIDKGTVKLDLTKKPKAMDIVGNDGPNKNKTFLAIYELNGDTLRICYDLSGKARPTEFKTQPDALIFLVNYKRSK